MDKVKPRRSGVRRVNRGYVEAIDRYEVCWRAFIVLGLPGNNGLFLWKGVRKCESPKSIILTADGKEVAEGTDSDEAVET